MKTYPVSRMFFLRPPGHPAPFCMYGIFADTKTKEQHDDVWFYIELNKYLLATNIAGDTDHNPPQVHLDKLCADIQRDYRVECRGIIAQGFDGFKYSTNSPQFKEAIHRE